MAKSSAGKLAAAALGWVAGGSKGPLPKEVRALHIRGQAKVIQAAHGVGRVVQQKTAQRGTGKAN
jgi:hypothetical protein